MCFGCGNTFYAKDDVWYEGAEKIIRKRAYCSDACRWGRWLKERG
jgi:hypothetical protein